jgi:PAS domain S-box-containing protein
MRTSRHGSVDYFVGLVLDITDRKRAEERLQRSEAYLAEGQRLSDTGSWAWNVSSGELFWSREHFRIYGLDPENFKPTKETTQRLIHAEDLPFVEQTLERAVLERSDFEVDYRIIRPDGSIRYHRGLGHPVVKESGELEFIGTVVDVTERKRAEEELRRSEAFLAEGQRISHTGSWAVSFPSGDVFWSPEMFRIYGLDPGTTKLSQQMAFQLIHPEDRAFVEEAFERAVREKSDYAVEHRAILADRSIKHLHALGHPVLNEFGELIECVGTVMDVTERKRAEEALHTAQAELARVTRMTTMGELAASIAHEINQPLGAIVNNGNVAIRIATAENSSLDELVEVLSDIVSDANRTSAIIARIRAVMRKSTPEKISLQLKDVVADVLALAHRELADHRITVRTELPEDLPRVLGDRAQLQQVLLNLVMNGIEAMDAMADERRILTIGGQRDELDSRPAVLITVRDLGDGFKTADSERLFDAFYTTKPDGLGMGLRISHSIVEAHGGRLWATSGAGPGATFYCALPAE